MAEERRHDGEDGDGRLARHTGTGVALGVGIGTVLFALTGDAVWIALGTGLGAGFGAAFSSIRD